MSDLREKLEGILQAGDMFLEPPEDMAEFIDKGAIKHSRADQILAAFKAHIKGLEKPENAFADAHARCCCLTGMIAMREALMESLE